MDKRPIQSAMDVNITEDEMFIVTVSNSKLQLTFKKIPLSTVGVISKISPIIWKVY